MNNVLTTLSGLSVTYKHDLYLLNWIHFWYEQLVGRMARWFSVHGLLFLQHGSHSLLTSCSWPEIIVLGGWWWLIFVTMPCYLVHFIGLFYGYPNLEKVFFHLHNRANYKWVFVFRSLDWKRNKPTIPYDFKWNKCCIPVKLSLTQENIYAETWRLEVSHMWTWITHKIYPAHYFQRL